MVSGSPRADHGHSCRGIWRWRFDHCSGRYQSNSKWECCLRLRIWDCLSYRQRCGGLFSESATVGDLRVAPTLPDLATLQTDYRLAGAHTWQWMRSLLLFLIHRRHFDISQERPSFGSRGVSASLLRACWEWPALVTASEESFWKGRRLLTRRVHFVMFCSSSSLLVSGVPRAVCRRSVFVMVMRRLRHHAGLRRTISVE